MKNTLSPRQQGIGYVLFAIMVWSGWMVLSSHGVRGSLTAYDITALRFGVAGIILLPVLVKKGFRIGPYGVLGSIFLAAMMGAPYNTIAIIGLKYAPASHAAGIINTMMLTITTIAGVYLLGEKTDALRIGGVALSIGGIACLLVASGPGSSEHVMFGHLMLVAAGAMWAMYTINMRAWKVDPLQATAAVCVLSCLIYLPIYFLFLPSQIGMHNLPEATFQALYQGILNSILALYFYNRGVALLGASTSSAFLPLVPIVSMLLAIPLLDQTPGMLEWAGIGLAAAGVFLSTGILKREYGNTGI